ncbi:hypothetical protein KAR91_72460 [Candidatus Pacearchaeota archaeon]|nr:hypothetical protein [Candidatus Pacearchaeota archaeon]
MFKKFKQKRITRKVKKIKKALSKIPSSEQVGIAVGVLGSIMVNYPRHERRGFLKRIVSLLEELVKTQTEKKGDEIATRH